MYRFLLFKLRFEQLCNPYWSSVQLLCHSRSKFVIIAAGNHKQKQTFWSSSPCPPEILIETFSTEAFPITMPPLLAPTRHPHLNCGRSRCSTKSDIGSPSLHSSPVHHLLQRSPASTAQYLQNEVVYAHICGLHVPVHFWTNSDAGDILLRMRVTSGRWSGHTGVSFEKTVLTATVK